MIPERGPQTVFKQFLSGAINVLQSIECNLCSAMLQNIQICNIAKLHFFKKCKKYKICKICNIVKMQNCKIAKLQNMQNCKIAKYAKLQNCKISKYAK